MRSLLRYWGYLSLALAIAGWVVHLFTLTVVLILSVAAVGYFTLQAPVWCGAVTRTGQLCRNNSMGLLLGCHLREHKWQKLTMAFVPKKWRDINRGLWTSPREGMATLSGIAAAVSAVAAVAAIALH